MTATPAPTLAAKSELLLVPSIKEATQWDNSSNGSTAPYLHSSISSSISSTVTSTNVSTAVSLSGNEKDFVKPASLEDQTYMWSGYLEDELPEKSQGRAMRNLRHQIFYLYRRLFGVVFLTNFGIFIAVIVQGANSRQIGQIVLANLFVAILMRQDYVIDAFFTVLTAVPSS